MLYRRCRNAILNEEGETTAVKGSGSLIELSNLTSEQRQKLNALLNKDGYDVLSKHFVRERDSWNEYKVEANEKSYQIEVIDRNGKVIKAYKADRLL